MADSFDPYHKWLGISPKDQPPNHYRLLGIELFESDPDVIEGAADQRMSHVRTFQTGQNSALSQRILNELSAAKLSLLDPQKKANYDKQLQAKLLSASARPAPVAEPLPVARPLPVSEPTPLFSVSSAAPVGIVRRGAPKKPAWQQPVVLGGIGGAIVLLAASIYFVTAGGKPSVAWREGENGKAGIPKSAALVEPRQPANAQPTETAATRSAATTAKATPDIKPAALTAAPDKPDFEILDASWGIGDKWSNVTDALRRQVKDHRLVTMVWSNLFGSPEDPAKGVAKNLRIRYRARGREYAAEYPDYFFVYLDGNPLAPPTESPDGLELLEARYGAGDNSYIDVLPQARKQVRDGYFSVAADDFYQKDIIPEGWKADQWAGIYKVLWVRYRNSTGEHFAYAWSAQPLTIDCRAPQTAGPPIDLLKQIDINRDVVQGKWKLERDHLAAPGGMYDRLLLPADVPDEYVLTMVVQADGELRDVSAGLAIGGRQTICCIDGAIGLSTGLNLVNGAWFSQAERNPTSSWRMSRLLEQGRPNTLTYIVRKTGLQLLRDGAELVRWSGDPQTLSLPDRGHVPNPRRVFIQSYDMPYHVSKLELAPLAPAKSEVLTQLEPGKPVDALKAIDLERDSVHGHWEFDGQSLVSAENDRGRIQIPIVLPEEYRLDVIAARESGGDHLSFTLPVGGVQTSLVIDAYDGNASGLQTIDGKTVKQAGENETRYEGSIFGDGSPKAISISVRKNRVQMSCDGRQLVNWTGDVSRLGPTVSLPYKDRVYLGNWYSRYRITKFEVTSLVDTAQTDAVAVPAGKPIDLLSAIDLKKDAVAGKWKKTGGALITPDEPFSRLMLPAPPSPEYQVTVVAERRKGDWGLGVGLVIEGHQVIADIDGYDGRHSGLDDIDGRACNNNETTRTGRLLVDGKPSTLVYTVRRNCVQVSLDGRTIIDWRGDPKRLSMIEDWKIPDPTRLSLNTFKTVCRISKIEVTPLVESESPSANAGEPINVLKQVDVKRDAVAGDWKTADGALVSPDAPFSKLLLPAPPSPEYQLTIVGQKVKGSYGLAVALAIGGRQVMADIDGVDGTYTGVSLVDGKNPRDSGEGRHGRLLPDGKESTFVYTVRRNSIQVTLDGHTVIDWRGDPSRLSIVEGYKLPDTTRLALCEYETVLRISKIELAPLTPQSGSASASTHSPDAPTQPTPPNAGRPRSLGDLVAGDGSRLPPPDDAAQKKARQDMQKAFGSELAAAKTVQEKRQLAEKLVKLAGEAHEDNATPYVLLRQAADLAEAAGELDLAWQATDKLAQRYAIDAIDLEHQSLTELGKAAKSPQEAAELARAACRLLAAALAAEQPAAVKKIAAQAQSFAKRTKDASLVKEVGLRTRDATRLAAELEAASTARKTLETRPDDPQANYTVGHYELCAKGDWNLALPKLAQGSEANWQSLAREELDLAGSRPKPGRQLALANGWWTLAEKEPWPGRHHLRMRAAEYYRLARSSRAGKDQAVASERLKAVLADGDDLPRWEAFEIFRGEKAGGQVRLDSSGILRTAVQYDGAIEVAFEARTNGKLIQLLAHGQHAVTWSFGATARSLFVTRPDRTTQIAKVAPLEPNRWYSFRYAITPQGIAITIDGESVFTENGAYGAFSSSPVGIENGPDSAVDIRGFVVKQL